VVAETAAAASPTDAGDAYLAASHQKINPNPDVTRAVADSELALPTTVPRRRC
jgi:hypothetical protein